VADPDVFFSVQQPGAPPSHLALFHIGLISSVVGLYTTFVLQSLWNWFVTEAFHLSPVSFWVMYGLVLIIGMFAYDPNFEEKQQFKAIVTVLDACLPEEKRKEVNEQLDEQMSELWLEAGSTVFGKLVGNTFTLAVGWAVHIFLASA
jgi:hypothetical protein